MVAECKKQHSTEKNKFMEFYFLSYEFQNDGNSKAKNEDCGYKWWDVWKYPELVKIGGDLYETDIARWHKSRMQHIG